MKTASQTVAKDMYAIERTIREVPPIRRRHKKAKAQYHPDLQTLVDTSAFVRALLTLEVGQSIRLHKDDKDWFLETNRKRFAISTATKHSGKKFTTRSVDDPEFPMEAYRIM